MTWMTALPLIFQPRSMLFRGRAGSKKLPPGTSVLSCGALKVVYKGEDELKDNGDETEQTGYLDAASVLIGVQSKIAFQV